MIKLGKLDNGVALFDFEDKTKIIIQTDNMQNILVCFDASEYDKSRPDGNWFIKDFDVLRKDNKEICELLDKLYGPYLEMINSNPNEYSFVDYKTPIKRVHLFRTVSGDKTELLYPSEDTSFENSTMLGITKYGQHGYMMTFHKSVVEKNKRSVYIRNEGSRIPGLFPLYNNCFKGIASLANNDFEDINKEFHEYINTDNLLYKHLNLTI